MNKSYKFRSNIAEVESRTQGSRPRTQKKPKDSLSEDRHSRGQGHKCSPKKKKKKKVFTNIFLATSKKKRSSQKFFKRSPQKNVFQKIFQALHKILTIQKIVLSSSRGLEAKDFKMCPRGLHLWNIVPNCGGKLISRKKHFNCHPRSFFFIWSSLNFGKKHLNFRRRLFFSVFIKLR